MGNKRDKFCIQKNVFNQTKNSESSDLLADFQLGTNQVREKFQIIANQRVNFKYEFNYFSDFREYFSKYTARRYGMYESFNNSIRCSSPNFLSKIQFFGRFLCHGNAAVLQIFFSHWLFISAEKLSDLTHNISFCF